MSTRFLKTAALMILATASAFALADDDTPSRVGRISLAQGQVDISGEQGDEAEPALVNWPVTSNSQLTTGRDSRTEVRIGSTALRLDADTSIDVNALEDDSLRITLHYGSLSIRVRNPDVLRGFELDTPQGTIRLQDTGRVRVDAGRRADTTALSVFEGEATFDGAGSRLIVRAGKRAEVTRDDVRTGLALRDSFDEWGMMRDVRDERSESVRYVTSEMTGYEDLDQHGAWSQDSEYGPVWYPRTVSAGWVPYRDGRWTYLQPWGWTWVDNAPWGYAPFHYGRWVTVGGRWCWSPGRNVTRAVWSPALVGWVGGSNWNVSFNSGGSRRAAPATGWYPLNPRDTYVPTYRVNHDNLRYLNRNAGDVRDDIRGRNRPDNRGRAGLTVVPHDQFRQRGTVVVPTMPRAIVSAALAVTAPTYVPPAPVVVRQREHRGNDGWRGQDRNGDGRADNNGRFQRNERGQQNGLQQPAPRPSSIISNPNQPQNSQSMPGNRPATVLTLPSQPQQPQQPQQPRRFVDGPELRRENTSNMPTPAPALPPQLQNPPQQQQRDERFNRGERNDRNDPERDRRSRGAESWQQQNAQQQQAQQQRQQQEQQFQQQRQQDQQRQQQQRQQQEQQQMQRQQMEQQQRQQDQQRQQQEQQRQQRVAPPSMPSPQVQQQQPQQQMQQAPRQAPPPSGQPEKADKPAQSRPMTTDEGKRRAREDSDRR